MNPPWTNEAVINKIIHISYSQIMNNDKCTNFVDAILNNPHINFPLTPCFLFILQG